MPLERIGKYRILEEVGRGGMAVVYRAEDTVLGRVVALKLLHSHLAADEEARARLAAEAKAVARLHHPLIPEVYEYAETEVDGELFSYIVTEFVEGRTLASYIRNHHLDVAESALLVVHRILEPLAHAHSQGIVHRDIKPENIMITQEGEPRLMDFGIARVLENPRLTATGQILGSPAYMAPEILQSEPATFASDVFSVGIILYRLLTGRLPFEGTSPHAVLVKIVECDYPDPEALRPEMGGLIASFVRRVLSLDPQDRPQDAGEMLSEIRELLSYAGIQETEVPSLASRVLTDPESFEPDLKGRVVDGLTSSLDRMGKGARYQTLSRLLIIAPEDEEVQERWLRFHAQRSSRNRPALMAATGVVMVLGAFAWGVYGSSGTHIEPFDGPSLPAVEEGISLEPQRNLQANESEPESVPPGTNSVPSAGGQEKEGDVPPRQLVEVASHHPTHGAKGVRPPKTARDLRRIRRVIAERVARRLGKLAVRTFRIIPFPQGQVKVFLDGKFLGMWGPGTGVEKVEVGPGRHVITLRHPLCYERTVVITPERSGGDLRVRLPWRSARLVVRTRPDAVVAVRILEGERRMLAGLPNAPIEIPFPKVWDRSELKVKVIVSLPGGRTEERTISVRAGSIRHLDVGAPSSPKTGGASRQGRASRTQPPSSPMTP